MFTGLPQGSVFVFALGGFSGCVEGHDEGPGIDGDETGCLGMFLGCPKSAGICPG
jgi:hypothetical protein